MAAGIVEAPLVDDDIVIVSPLPNERLVRWTVFVARARRALEAELAQMESASKAPTPPAEAEPSGGRPRGAWSGGRVVLFVADSSTQARIVRAGALESTASPPLGSELSSHHTKPGDASVTIVVDGSGDVSRAQEDLLLDLTAATLHQYRAEVALPLWVVEGVAAATAVQLKVEKPWHEATRSQVVAAIRADPARALKGLAAGDDALPGTGWLAAELLERERPGAMMRLVRELKARAALPDALKKAAGVSPRQLAEAMSRWYQTND